MGTIYRAVGSVLQLVQTVTTNPYAVSASSFLNLKQTVRQSPIPISVFSQLLLEQKLNPRRSITNCLIHHNIVISHSAKRVRDANAYNILSLFQSADHNPPKGLIQQLSLIQLAIVERVRPASSTLILNQTVTVNRVVHLSVTSILQLHSAVNGFKINPNFVSNPVTLPGGDGGNDGRCSE